MSARLTMAALAVIAAGCGKASAEVETTSAVPPPVAKEDLHEVYGPPAAPPVDAARPPRSFAGKTVLHVGDSMVGGSGGLTRALEAKFAAAGARFTRETSVSESIASFDLKGKPSALVASTKADVVILTLGANDVFLPHPEVLAKHVARIAQRIGTRECWWMAPPLWKPDTGVVAVIEAHAAPCRFFDASGLSLPRASDGIHPTDKGGAIWADAFWDFVQTTDER